MTTKAQPKQWAIDPAHTIVEVAANHLVIGKVKARFKRFEVDLDYDEAHPERTSFVARIDPASVDTGDEKRDAHLRSPDFFHVEKFPWIIFRSQKVHPLGEGRYKIIGDLTVRDVTRQVTLDATLTQPVKDPWGKLHVGFSAETTVNRKDFGLQWNIPLEEGGMLVGDLARISIDAELVKQA